MAVPDDSTNPAPNPRDPYSPNPLSLIMAATSSATPPTPAPAPPDLDVFEHHWQDEADAAYLYRLLSAAEADAQK